MPLEIERKFLVTNDDWKHGATATEFLQGYLSVGPPASVRIRIEGDAARLNIKRSTLDIAREEYEYAVPVEEAREMLKRLCEGRLVKKTRHVLVFESMTWEVDEFHGANEGLIVAEIELSSEDQAFVKPPWLGEEVSGDARYTNSSLSVRPYSSW